MLRHLESIKDTRQPRRWVKSNLQDFRKSLQRNCFQLENLELRYRGVKEKQTA